MIRNEDGYWINSQVFREEAINFEKNGYYTKAPKKSPEWMEYWLEQHRRAREGYSVGGVKITGHHYFYLNFCQIKRPKKVGRQSRNIVGFPDFWAGDYNWFWAIDIARYGMDKKDYDALNLDINIADLSGGLDVITGKARRKGFSYKVSGILANVFANETNTDNLIVASDSAYLYPKGTMSMVKDHIHFMDQHTEFRRAKLIDTKAHIQCGFKKRMGGVEVEDGRKNHIRALTLKDNPDKGRGSNTHYVMMEEGGTFPNLIDSYEAIKPSTEAGADRTGQIIIYGTSSKDIDGNTADFIDMFYNPEKWGLLPIYNIWDEDSEDSTCSFFFPDYWGKIGFIDDQGNDSVQEAIDYEVEKRNVIKSTGDSASLLGYVVERPFNPGEAFLIAVDNDFPTIELRKRLQYITQKGTDGIERYKKVCEPVYLHEAGDQVKDTPDWDGNLSPIWRLNQDVQDQSGAAVIIRRPREDMPFGYYKIGYDPYRQDKSGGPSFASILVYESRDDNLERGDEIVAFYFGRPETYDDADKMCLKLAKYYNAEVMYENEVTHPKDYFKSKNALNYLARQPTNAINAVIKDSKVQRVYGMHMTDKLKDTAAKYVKKWLLEVRTYDEDGNPILNLDNIWDPGLIEELIRYNRKNNFDRVSALFMLMYAIEEEPATLRTKERDKEEIVNQLAERYNRMTHGAQGY